MNIQGFSASCVVAGVYLLLYRVDVTRFLVGGFGMFQEVRFSTIDDVADSSFGYRARQEDGLTSEQAREAELAYAREISDYDSSRGGFFIKQGFIPDDPEVWDESIYNRQVDAWEEAVALALEEV